MRFRSDSTRGSALFVVGLLLRVATWPLLGPSNRDFHLGVILRMVSTGRIPISNDTDQSYHPPLYYLITAPIFAVTHRPKVVQLFSLACAIATLYVFYRLIVFTPLFGRMRDRLILFAIVVVHPQLIAYGLYLSNDTLTILLGSLVAWQLWRWVTDPSPGSVRTLAVICGLGLLTKATFVAIVPVVAVLLALIGRRFDRATATRRAIEFAAIAIVVGSYKFIQNDIHFGTPFVTNLDNGLGWVAEQAQGRTLPWAYLGFDPTRWLSFPLMDGRRPYLEQMYETFWYEPGPMSNLQEARRSPYYLTGSALLVAAVVPTVLMAWGVVVGLAAFGRQLFAGVVPNARERVQLARGSLIALWVAVLMLLVIQEARTHVWSIMHARLMLPAIAGGLVALRIGWDTLRRLAPGADRLVAAWLMLTCALMLVQHASDLALVLAQRLGH
jgi:hypothetical protein